MGLPGVYFNSGPVHKEGVYSWVFLAWHGYPKKIFILERLFTHLLCSRHSADHGDYRVPVTLPFLSWAASDWVPSMLGVHCNSGILCLRLPSFTDFYGSHSYLG